MSASKEGGDWHLEAGALGKYSSHFPATSLITVVLCKCLPVDSDCYEVELQDLDFHKGLRIKYMLPKIIRETSMQVPYFRVRYLEISVPVPRYRIHLLQL